MRNNLVVSPIKDMVNRTIANGGKVVLDMKLGRARLVNSKGISFAILPVGRR